MILSRYSIKDLPCKFPKQIYYSKSLKQQRKERIKHASRHEDEEQQETQSKSTGGLQMYTHRNRQTTG